MAFFRPFLSFFFGLSTATGALAAGAGDAGALDLFGVSAASRVGALRFFSRRGFGGAAARAAARSARSARQAAKRSTTDITMLTAPPSTNCPMRSATASQENPSPMDSVITNTVISAQAAPIILIMPASGRAAANPTTPPLPCGRPVARMPPSISHARPQADIRHSSSEPARMLFDISSPLGRSRSTKISQPP